MQPWVTPKVGCTFLTQNTFRKAEVDGEECREGLGTERGVRRKQGAAARMREKLALSLRDTPSPSYFYYRSG